MRSSLYSLVKRFARDERGASLVEYAVLVGLITTALIGLVTALGTQIGVEFTEITNELANQTN